MVFFSEARKNKRECTVPGDVAGRAEAVLKCKNSEHQSGTGIVKAEDTDNEAQRSHDRSTRNTRGTDGKIPRSRQNTIIVPGAGTWP